MPAPPSKTRRIAARTVRPQPTRCTPQLGCWELVEVAGRGSYADIFSARPRDCDDLRPADYAVKRLRKTHESDSLAVEMFRREVACGTQVSHAHLVPILASRTEAAPYYYVMPRLTGATVEQVVAADIEFSTPHAMWIVRQIADAIHSLHAAGWLHGDIKPANIMVAATGHATLIDYGFARPWRSGNAHDNVALMTTIAYTAPERLTSSRAAGPASDVYGLGIVLFEMLTGSKPFACHQPERMAESHLRIPPPSVRTLVPSIPRSISQLVSRMLAKEPDRRPTASGELQSELMRLEAETFALRR